MKCRISLAVGALLTATALAGCGGSTSADSGSSDEESGPGAAASPQVGTPAIANNGTLAVCTALSTGNPPTYFFENGQEPTGAEIDMARSVARRLGLEVDFFDVAFASIIPSLQAGQCDVIMSSLYIKPEREEIVDFVPYLMSGTALAVGTGNPEGITGMDDSVCGLRMTATVGKTAALLANEAVAQCAADGLPELRLSEVENVTAGIQQVMTGQADVYAGETPVILYYADKQPDTFEMGGDSFGEIEVGAAVAKGNTELQEAIAGAFEEMKADGEYDEILAEWNLTELGLL